VFLGEFEHALDDKGRIAIPAKFRASLGDGLVVTRGLERCLFVWPMEEWRVISQKLAQLSLMSADARRIHRLIFAGATDAEPDRLGRVVLPAFLRDYAQLQEGVVLIGLMNRIEIWSRDNWQAERALAEQQSAELAAHLFDLGI